MSQKNVEGTQNLVCYQKLGQKIRIRRASVACVWALATVHISKGRGRLLNSSPSDLPHQLQLLGGRERLAVPPWLASVVITCWEGCALPPFRAGSQGHTQTGPGQKMTEDRVWFIAFLPAAQRSSRWRRIASLSNSLQHCVQGARAKAGVSAAEGRGRLWLRHPLLLLSLIFRLGKENTLNHKVAHVRRIQESVWWL